MHRSGRNHLSTELKDIYERGGGRKGKIHLHSHLGEDTAFFELIRKEIDRDIENIWAD